VVAIPAHTFRIVFGVSVLTRSHYFLFFVNSFGQKTGWFIECLFVLGLSRYSEFKILVERIILHVSLGELDH